MKPKPREMKLRIPKMEGEFRGAGIGEYRSQKMWRFKAARGEELSIIRDSIN